MVPQFRRFRTGYALIARRYKGYRSLLSLPGLTDMLKFGPLSSTAQVDWVFWLDARKRLALDANAVPYSGFLPETFEGR